MKYIKTYENIFNDKSKLDSLVHAIAEFTKNVIEYPDSVHEVKNYHEHFTVRIYNMDWIHISFNYDTNKYSHLRLYPKTFREVDLGFVANVQELKPIEDYIKSIIEKYNIKNTISPWHIWLRIKYKDIPKIIRELNAEEYKLQQTANKYNL